MRHKGPIITLLAGLLVAGVLFALNVNLSHDATRDAAAKNAAANATASASSPSAASKPTSSQAPSPAKAPEGKSTYAGETDGGSAGLAIAANNGKAVAYVCDGKAAEAWLSGSLENGKIELRSATGASGLSGTYANGYAEGTVSAGKKTWHFKIKLAKPPSGLYRTAAGARTRLNASWAVTPPTDNQQAGVKQFGVKQVGDSLAPAPPLDTTTNTAMVDGKPVPVEAADPDKRNW
jgi:hypothetical protein